MSDSNDQKDQEPPWNSDAYYIKKKVDNPNWTPYCGVCRSMARMADRNFGYECIDCRNKIGFDCKRLPKEEGQNG